MEKSEFTAEPGSHEAAATAVFDAPREKLYRLVTDPALVPKWWGPRDWKITVEKMDVRPGGGWRYIQHDPSGKDFAYRGVYQEVGPDRLVFTFESEDMPGNVMLDTATFEQEDGKTKFTIKSLFATVEDRDRAIKGGMKEGTLAMMERFAEALRAM